jgi:galactokinase
MAIAESIAHVARTFERIHGRPPQWRASAPGRVNLIGEHTDYNDGFVLPMALEQCTVIVAGPSADKNVTIRSLTNGESASFKLSANLRRSDPPWVNYVVGVVAGFQNSKIRVPGFDAVIGSDVPLGGGLSSSAALEVSTATLLEAITGRQLDPVKKALLCQKAEHEFAGVPCGIMDQFISVMARKDHLLLLDCRSQKMKWAPMADQQVTVMIVNTNVRHKLADGEYAKRRAECDAAARALKVPALRDATRSQLQAAQKGMDPLLFRRARHVITENDRTLEAAVAMQRGDWNRVGELMFASHASLRDDYEVSCSELDVVVEAARSIGAKGGVYGCRMTGGGFGGCTVALVKTSAARQIGNQISEAYEIKTQNQAAIFSSRPGGGAAILSTDTAV